MLQQYPHFIQRLRYIPYSWKYFQQQNLRDRIYNFIIYIITGKTNNTISLLNENYYKTVQLSMYNNDDILLYQIQKGWERRCTPHETLCPPYFALTHCTKSYCGRDILLECLQSGHESIGLNFHSRRSEFTLFSITDLKQIEQCEKHPENGVFIFTSIGPNRLEAQKAAIYTWIAQGFTPVAINYLHEIESLQTQFPEVTFVPVLRDTTQELGRPRVFLNDVVDYARKMASANANSVVGLVNSDVGLYRLDVPLLLEVASRGLVFSRRAEVSSHIHSEGSVYDYGYDVMFFNPNLLPDLPETSFALGEPWWDLVFPMYVLLHAIPTYACVPVLGFHVDHEVNWSEKAWIDFADTSVKLLVPLFDDHRGACPDLYKTLQNAKENMHNHIIFLSEFAYLTNHILNTIPDVVDCVIRNKH